MKRFRQLLRLITINMVFLRHGLDEIIFTLPPFRPVRYVYKIFPWNWFRKHEASREARLRMALEDLGPIFIKFGQMLSTRRDLLTPELAEEMAKLQDNVPSFSSSESRDIIEQSLKRSIDELFAEFETEPMASASIAQVHAAETHDGRKVVVKVVRPGIEKVIHRDVELMYILARLAQRYWPDGKRLRPVEVVEEYEKTIIDELDLMREAANCSQLKRNFDASPLLYIPGIDWNMTSNRVMVMERIYGIPVGDFRALKEQGVNMQALAEHGVEIFFTQVFAHNFFHADMHPGNIFVNPETPDSPQYIAVDFGIVGTLTDADQRYLAENFYAFFRRDYRRVAELHVESGWVPASTRVGDFEAAIRTVCEPIFERPLREISFGHFLLRLFQTARRFNMEVQPQLVLLQKTLLNIEGLGRDLYPDLDLWKTAKPFIENWMHEQMGVKALARGMKTHLPKLLETLPEMPILLHDVARKASQDQLVIHQQSQDISSLRKTLRQNHRNNMRLMLGLGLLVSGVLLLNDGPGPSWGGYPAISLLAMATGITLALKALFKAPPE
ncbi:MAG: ubiquinone biosynthesis regulatory protein kinase UbiB [bacterium]